MGRVLSFEFEADMCATLSRQLARLSSKRFRVVRHLQVGVEIPDYVVAFAPHAKKLARLSALECAVLARLESGTPAGVAKVADDLFAQIPRIDAALQRLEKLGYAIGNAEAYVSREVLSPARVIAIEAKLTRWRDAVEQAISYRRFANASYVALPYDVIQSRRAAFTADCAEASIGLIGVGRERITIDIPAPFHEPRTSDWVWTVTRSLSDEFSAKQRTSGRQRATCVGDLDSFAG